MAKKEKKTDKKTTTDAESKRVQLSAKETYVVTRWLHENAPYCALRNVDEITQHMLSLNGVPKQLNAGMVQRKLDTFGIDYRKKHDPDVWPEDDKILMCVLIQSAFKGWSEDEAEAASDLLKKYGAGRLPQDDE